MPLRSYVGLQTIQAALIFSKVSSRVGLSQSKPILRFNSTRSRFWGHDRAMEWSFFVTGLALKRLQPSAERDEASLLRALSNREKIYAAATKAYTRGRKGSYELSVADF
jgi:hypothetical protein